MRVKGCSAPIEALVTQNKLIENNKWNTELLAYAVTFISRFPSKLLYKGPKFLEDFFFFFFARFPFNFEFPWIFVDTSKRMIIGNRFEKMENIDPNIEPATITKNFESICNRVTNETGSSHGQVRKTLLWTTFDLTDRPFSFDRAQNESTLVRENNEAVRKISKNREESFTVILI